MSEEIRCGQCGGPVPPERLRWRSSRHTQRFCGDACKREWYRGHRKREYARLLAEGRCQGCGKSLDGPSKYRCVSCQEKHAQLVAARRAARRAAAPPAPPPPPSPPRKPLPPHLAAVRDRLRAMRGITVEEGDD